MKFADLMFVVLLDAMCTDNEGGITLCINTVVYCHVVCSMPIKCMRNVYGMREFTGKYTKVWQRLSSESPSLIVPTLRGIARS